MTGYGTGAGCPGPRPAHGRFGSQERRNRDIRPFTFSATVGAGEQMVLAPQRHGSDRALDGIVVELDTAVVQEVTEGRPAGKGVTDRVGEATAARNATKLRLEPRLHRLDKRSPLGIAHAPALFRSPPPSRLLHPLELANPAPT